MEKKSISVSGFGKGAIPMESVVWHEFITIALVHLLAVITPGVDFAMVVRQNLNYGRKIGVWTSLGIGMGMILHCGYTLLGLGLLISKSILFFNILKYLGALYLAYLGLQSLLRRNAKTAWVGENRNSVQQMSSRQALWSGFLVNALNPKATLFFVSIFSVIVSPETPLVYQVGYCAWIFMIQILWFSGLSLILSHRAVLGFFQRTGHWVERVMGLVLLGLGLKLALSGND